MPPIVQLKFAPIQRNGMNSRASAQSQIRYAEQNKRQTALTGISFAAFRDRSVSVVVLLYAERVDSRLLVGDNWSASGQINRYK
jgi:hypothetical protein